MSELPEIRLVREEDLDSVLRIENESFKNPWARKIFSTLSRWRGCTPIGEKRRIYMRVAEEDNTIVGYVVWEENYRTEEGRILNLAVSAKCQRKGIGTALVQFTFTSMRDSEIRMCFLEARVSNQPARALYENLGMSLCGTNPEYYGDEDAVIYFIKLSDTRFC